MSGRAGLLALVAIALVLLAGCGGSDSGETSIVEPASPEPSALARIAFEDPVSEIDPIFARSRSERLVSRQIFGPLFARTASTLGQPGRRRGPARVSGVSASRTLWRFQLRSGLRFQDGSPFNPDAVIANVERWLASGTAARELPELIAADSPRPGEVRFQLSRAVENLPARLDRPALGLVSAPAITARGLRPVRRGDAGAGPFELREREATRLLLVRSPEWWGLGLGSGPGVERLEFLVVPSDGGRADQLKVGVVDIADQLGAAAAASVEADPLLTTVSGGGTVVGLSASVRGVESTNPSQSLASLWLTDLR